MKPKPESTRLNGGLKTLFGLFIIWLSLYLVAVAQDISSRGKNNQGGNANGGPVQTAPAAPSNADSEKESAQ